MASDSSEPASAAHHTAPRVQPVRSKARASKKPSGAYPIRLDVTSKPVQYGGGSGAARNIQGSSPWARQPEKGNRLAKTIKTA